MSAVQPPVCGWRSPREKWVIRDSCAISFRNAAGLILLMGLPVRRGLALRAGSSSSSSSSSKQPSRAPRKAAARKQPPEENATTEEATSGASDQVSLRTLYRKNVNAEERELRSMFLESLMEHARSADVAGAEQVMSDMVSVGIKPGPRSYHGLVAAYSRANDLDGAMYALNREVLSGETPFQETFVAVGRLLGRKGQLDEAKKLLGRVNYHRRDLRSAWNLICEELFKAGHLDKANELFMMGAQCEFRASDYLYDSLVEENCKTARHAKAIDILRSMEARGRQATTFHYNSLLLAQGNANLPEIAAKTFETMEYLRPETKPNTESFNLMIKAHTRCTEGERYHQVIELVGHMSEYHPRGVEPNAETYALVTECCVKSNFMPEALRHFRALTRQFPGSLHVLHRDGKFGDPLSLLIRSLCLHGMIAQLIEVFELMKLEGLKLTPRAMFVNRKGRSLVSSWIDPCDTEPDIGREVDFVARYIAEGGLDGTRRRWTPKARKDRNKVLPDHDGYRFFPPIEKSYRKFCFEKRREYKRNLIELLDFEGMYAMGEDANEEEYTRVLTRLKSETSRKRWNELTKPKAASKLSVVELKRELEGQDLPTDGSKTVLYQRVQKARRTNIARGRALWMPPGQSPEEAEEKVDEEFEAVLAKIDLSNPRMQYRKKCFLEGTNLEQLDKENPFAGVVTDSEEDEDEESDSDFEDDEEPALDERKKKPEDKEFDADDEEEILDVVPELPKPLPKPERRTKSCIADKRAELVEDRFDFREWMDIEEIWGWTWERKYAAQPPEIWSRKREVELSMEVIRLVIDLGGNPTLGDCAMLVQNAIKIPWPESIVSLIEQAHKCGHKFGSKLYQDAVTACLSVEDRNSAIAVLNSMDDTGVRPSSHLLGQVLPDN